MKRLVEAVRQAEGNCSLHAFPSPVRSILDNMAGPTALDGLVSSCGCLLFEQHAVGAACG